MEAVLFKTVILKQMQMLSARSRRLWVASPFLGRRAYQVFPRSLFDRRSRDIRLLTSRPSKEVSYVDPECAAFFMRYGEVRMIPQLHAKIYIFDSKGIVSSANLTRLAFERNLEVGVLVGGNDFLDLERVFGELWDQAVPLKQDFLEDMQHLLKAEHMKLRNPDELFTDRTKHSIVPEWQPERDRADGIPEGLRQGATQYVLSLIGDEEIELGELQEKFFSGFVKRHDRGRIPWWRSRNNSNQVRYKHGVRGILQPLVDQGLIRRPRRAVYVTAKEPYT